MRNKTLAAIFVVAALFEQGCSSGPGEAETLRKLTFRRTEVYTIPLTDSISSIGNYFQPPGSANVYLLDPVRFSLHVLNTNDGSLRLAGILPPQEEYDGFTVDEHAKRVYVFYSDSAAIYDLRGRFTGSLSWNDPPEGFLYMNGKQFSPLLKDGKLYLSHFPKIEGDFRNPAYFRQAVEAETDLRTHRIRLLAQGYPAVYQQQSYGYHNEATRMETGPDEHGYTFPHSDSIYLCNIRTGKRTTRFFGSRTPKTFEHIPFAKMKSLNEAAFLELVQQNPHYSFPSSAPLAGYYTRELVTTSKTGALTERLIVFDRSFSYIGEAVCTPYYLIDSKKGLLSMRLDDNNLLIEKISW